MAPVAPARPIKHRAPLAAEVATKKPRIDPIGPKRTSVIKHLGEGVSGYVYHVKQEMAIKVFRAEDIRDFDAENKAFEVLENCEALTGRIPTFFGEQPPMPFDNIPQDVQRKALGFEYIEGKTLKNCLSGLQPGELGRIQETLSQTLETLHAHGIAHNDVHWTNVMLRSSGPKLVDPIENSVILIDFSHSTLKSTLPKSQSWKDVVQKDYEKLKSSMNKAVETWESNVIERLHSGNDVDSLLSLYTANPQLDNPSLRLAAAIMAAFDARSGFDDALRFSEAYRPNGTVFEASFYIYRARHARVLRHTRPLLALTVFYHIVSESIDVLGLMHSATLDVGLRACEALVDAGKSNVAVRVAYFFLHAAYPMQKRGITEFQDVRDPATPSQAAEFTQKAIEIIRRNVGYVTGYPAKWRMEEFLRKFDAGIDLNLGMSFRDPRETNIMLFDQLWFD